MLLGEVGWITLGIVTAFSTAPIAQGARISASVDKMRSAETAIAPNSC